MKQLKWHWSALIMGLLLLAGCAGAATQKEPEWLAGEQMDHPLVGQLWSVKKQALVNRDMWLESLPDGVWLLVGEQHDHPDHQRLTHQWMLQLAAQQRLGPLALEMARQPQQPALDAALGQSSVTPEMLDWQPGWPWERYGELVQSGLLHARRVLAADLDMQQQRDAYQQGAPLPAISEAMAQVLDRMMDEGHCGQLPEALLPKMREVQLARDQAMAEVLLGVELDGRVGLLQAGSVHVRKDLGVPRWLPPDVKHVSVWLVQVDQRQQPQDYLPPAVDGLQVYDYLLFTPAIMPVDYCAAFQSSSRR